MTNEEFKEYQPVLYKLFISSKKNNRLANSYLLYGDYTAPIKECALLLLESINCKEDLACHKCPNCIKFESGNKSDFLIIDGKDKRITKEDVKRLEDKFTLTSLENNSKPVYLVNHIENISSKAINAMLKFLEEPKNDITAVLTTTNIEKVLPTIISRSIKIKINSLPKNILKDKMINSTFEYGKEKKIVDKRRAEVLSWLYSTYKQCKSDLEESEAFFMMFDMCEEFLKALTISSSEGSYTLLKNNHEDSSFKNENRKVTRDKCYNLLYLTLSNIFTSIVSNNIQEDNPFKEEMLIIAKKYDVVLALKEVNRLIYFAPLNLSRTLNSIKIIKALKGEKL